MRLGIFAILLLCGVVLPAYAQNVETSSVSVATVIAERRPITKSSDFVGRVESINRVEIKARVKGYLEAVLFKEGDLIKEGQPLYRIERGLFEAAVEQAQGALESSKSQYKRASFDRQRQEELFARGSGAAVEKDKAVAQEGMAKGAVMTDEANLLTAQINLGYTAIVSPITGRISRTNVTRGNVVGPDSGILTTIVSQDPMYVTFPVSQRDFLRVQNRDRGLDVKSIKVRILFADGTIYDQVGDINFVDVIVDKATDTVIVRATMPNPKGTLIDDQLVRVRAARESETLEEKVLIPQAALIADQAGVYVFVVEDGKAVVKRIKPSSENGTDVIVDDGLSGGEQIIVERLQSIRPGMAVRATLRPPAPDRS